MEQGCLFAAESRAERGLDTSEFSRLERCDGSGTVREIERRLATNLNGVKEAM